MEQQAKDFLEVLGEVTMYQVKSKTQSEWIKQARDAILRAEEYGATTPNQMQQKERDDLREALKALHQNPSF